MSSNKLIIVSMILIGLLLPSWLPALAFSTPSQSLKLKTYAIWSASVSGDWITSLQTIPDINDDGHEDVFVVSAVTGNGYLVLVDGRTGSVIRATSPLGYEPSEAVYVNGYIAVAKTGGIDVYDTQFNKLYTISASASDVTPEKLQTFDGTDLVFIDGTNVKSHLLSTGGNKWNRAGTITIEDLIVLSSQRAFYVWRNYWANRWEGLLIDDDGNALIHVYIRESTYYDSVHLNPYDQAHFLYTKTNDTMTVLRCDSIIGDTVTILWETQIDKWSEIFTIVDTNNDGMKEVIALWGGYLSVYSGASGALLYMTNIDAYDIRDVAVISDVDGDGVNDVAVYASYYGYLVSFRYSTYGIWWKEYSARHGIEAIQDVDGDGRKDVIAAHYNDLYCYWGYYDDKPPSIELVSPTNNTYIASKDITFQVNASDSQSGIDNVQIVVDWWNYDGVYNPTTGYYEVTLTLSEGKRSWYAYAYDKVGYGGYSEKTATAYLTIDATPPTVSITSPLNGTYLSSSNVSVSWYGSDQLYWGTGIERYEIRLDTDSWIGVETETSYTFTGVHDGNHTVTVKAFDKAGNTKGDSVFLTVDATQPSVSITSPTSEEFISSSSVGASWSGSDATSGIDYYEVKLDTGIWVDVGTATSHTFTNVDDGSHTIYVRAVDKAGIIKETSVSFSVDTTLPTVTITSPTSGTDFDTMNVTVTWSGSDETSGIDYYMVRMDDGSWINVSTSTGYTFTELSEEPHVASVNAVDKVGLREEVSVSFTIGMERATELTDQAESKIDSAKAAGFWSGDARSLLDKAISEYEVATQAFDAGDYESAKVHAQNAISYVDQAYATESSFKTVTWSVFGIGVVIAVVIAAYFLKIRKKAPQEKPPVT